MTSANPSKELRRLLSVLRDNLRQPGASDLRWQRSHLDNFVEKMLPLWAECGIDTPAFYIGRDTDPEYPIRLGVAFKSIEYRDPDDCESASIFLEAAPREGGKQVVATVDELADVANVADRWIDWIDARKPETKVDEIPQILVVPAAPPVEPSPASPVETIRPAWRQAYLAFKEAERQIGKQLTDPEAYGFLEDKTVELEWSYVLPSKRTFANYLNRARRHLNEPKYTTTAGRGIESRSVVKLSKT